jgi:hypothetical protein
LHFPYHAFAIFLLFLCAFLSFRCQLRTIYVGCTYHTVSFSERTLYYELGIICFTTQKNQNNDIKIISHLQLSKKSCIFAG